MIRFRLYFDKDAETKWLNEMSETGGMCGGKGLELLFQYIEGSCQ